MKPYLQGLNTVQRKAVTTTKGPVLVVAGPGSGKTRVLTFRIAHLIEEGVPPESILALTFTNKAAREMRERITKEVGNIARMVWAGTFHSIFARILRVEADKIGYPANFTIYDADDSKNLIKSIVKEMNLDPAVYQVNTVRARISSAKSNLITPILYKQDQNLIAQDRMSKRPYTHVIYEKYMARCRKAGAMDFDDLLYLFFALLHKNPENVVEKYRSKFKYLLVDEFQDTNYLQYRILKKLVCYPGSPKNLCVVGDDAQSIYAFRGATIDNILDFEKDFNDLKVFKLEQNYRSTFHIVQAANELISYNQKQIKKKIWTEKQQGNKIKIIKAITDNEEGKRVADTIVEQKNRYHLQNNEIAILYRTNAQSRILEEYLRKYNISYRVFGGLSFYQRKEVKDVIAYMRLAVNPQDEEALKRIINFPRRGIGGTTLQKISNLAEASDKPLWECLPHTDLPARAKNAVMDFVSMIKAFKIKAETADAYEMTDFIIRKSGIYDLLKQDKTIEGMGRLENVTALLDGAKQFIEEDLFSEVSEIEDKFLASYLQSIALLTDFDTDEDDNDYVTLMSVHSAKGLEFRSVFVVGMEEKLFPSFLSMDSREALDEERRLFYVAVTRAEEYLTLAFSKSRYQYGQMRHNEPSRFLEEIPEQHLDGISPRHTSPQKTTVTSGVKGNFSRTGNTGSNTLKADPKTFKPSPGNLIQTGMKVLHLKFGEGKVLSIDGANDNRVATIFFREIDNPQKRIMLRFAKLQILN